MKTALITGDSSGIGLAITKMLIELNYKVYGISRHCQNLDINSKNYIHINCDLTNINKLIECISNIKKKEDISLLINNAGVGYFGLHEEINPKKIHEMISLNLEAPLIITQMLLRNLKKNSGYIINISSVCAKFPSTHACAYGATKAGLTHFTNSLFEESRKYDVKAISIHPDITKSNFYKNADFKETDLIDTYLNPDEIANIIKFILLQRNEIFINDITIKPQRHMIQRKIK